MTIRTIWMPGLWTACLLVTSSACFGQANLTVDTRQRAENLSGAVYSEADGTRNGLADVIVAECMPGFKNCKMVVKTDEQGHFSVPSEFNTRVHYLQFLSPGFRESQVTVTLAKNGGELNVLLVSSL